MKKCKQALNDNTCDKDCCCYYCEDFETCGHACNNFDDKEELEQQGCEEQFDEETALQEFNKDSNALAIMQQISAISKQKKELEDKEKVIARIHEAAKYVPLDRLYLSPQCGFASCEIGNKLTEEELRTIVDVSHETGVIETEEKDMINNLFDFGDAEAKEVMVPRIDMTFADINNTYEELIELFRKDKFTRLPVYEDSTDNVIGIINMKDLLLYDDKETFHIRDILREPYYTYEHKNTAELFMDMRSSSISIAIVLDEYGATAGLITLEDLLEEIVGEIRDEYDIDEVDSIVWLGDREYEVLGSQNLEDLCEELGLKFESEDYDSIGGYVVGLLDHFPKPGESITTEDGVKLIVEAMDKNRVEKIRLILPEPEKEKDL